MRNSGGFLGKFDESKHQRNHGRFSSGVAVGAAVGATGGALLAGALLTRRLSGFGLVRRGAEAAGHAVSEAVHHVVDAAPQIKHVPRPHELNALLHGAHTPIGSGLRAGQATSARAQLLSRGHRGHATRANGKGLTRRERPEAEQAYNARRELAAQIREYRRSGLGKLAKFLDTQHPRDDHGRFSDESAAVQRRTQHKMPSYYRLAGRVPHGQAAPEGMELPVGSFTRAALPFHKPKGVSGADRKALEQGVVGVITKEREATVARGLEVRRNGPLIPEGTSKRAINRAYNHASMIAVHKYGLGHYDFAMDDELKAEMTPLEPFMRYAQRRVLNTMLAEHKGGWKPYRQEFGQTFKDGRKDADGNVRLRVKPLQQMIKAAEFGALCKATFGTSA